MTTSLQPMATTLEELRASHDQRFLECAYHSILGRAPDPEGIAHHLEWMRSGVPRFQILAALRLSSEAEARMFPAGGQKTIHHIFSQESQEVDMPKEAAGSPSGPFEPAELEDVAVRAKGIYFQIKKAATDLKEERD